MRSGFTLLIIREQSGTVDERRITPAMLWAAGVVLVGSLVAAGCLGWVLGQTIRKTGPIELSLAPVFRHGPASLAALTLPGTAMRARAQAGVCAPDMVLVEGAYCPEVHHRCKRHVDPEGSALRALRCAEYETPRCLSPSRQHLRFCMDRDEFVAENQQVPLTGQTFAEARQACAGEGKRLCSEQEWTFACEGEAMLPYPYGSVRDASRCNADQVELVSREGKLLDLRRPPGAFAGCLSPFGVRDLSGNVEEFVVRDGTMAEPIRKGAYWQPGANHCRASYRQEDPTYSGIELGFRCCADTGPRR